MVFEYRQKFDYVDLVMPDVAVIEGYLRDATVFVQEIRVYLFPVSLQDTSHEKEEG